MKWHVLILVVTVFIGGFAVFVFRDFLVRQVFVPRQTQIEEGVRKEARKEIEVFAESLQIPWEVAFLPNNEILITERPGKLLKIGQDRKVIQVQGVEQVGEGGLLGMALHPDFKDNSFIYLYLTTRSNGQLINRVERYKLEQNKLVKKTIILDGILGSAIHDGGRIEFGPDNFLYITTGDAGEQELAQDRGSLNGKILRIAGDGSIPEDNPFGSAVYSWGHRNSQGLAWDDQDRLWATEHGPSGLASGYDELNLIEAGKNYGWPAIKGEEEREGMLAPVIHSGSDDTWAPAGAVFWDGSLFFTGLRGEALYEAKIGRNHSVEEFKIHFRGEFGRLRAMVLGSDGDFYITTSNTDGRGTSREGDDRLIRINPQIFR